MSKKYNHMLDLTFTVISKTEDGSDITPAQIQQGILQRVLQLYQEGSWDIGGAIGVVDHYEVDEAINVTEALDLVVEACSQWRNLDEPLGTIIEALNKFMTEDGPLDYRRERPTGFIGPKELEEYKIT